MTNPSVVEGGEKQLPVSTIPVSVTMGKIGNYIVVDPNGDEWGQYGFKNYYNYRL